MSSATRHDQRHHPLSETDRALQLLWLALHYAIPDAPKMKWFYESASWTQYQSVNQRFADVIIADYCEGDIGAVVHATLIHIRVFSSGCSGGHISSRILGEIR